MSNIDIGQAFVTTGYAGIVLMLAVGFVKAIFYWVFRKNILWPSLRIVGIGAIAVFVMAIGYVVIIANTVDLRTNAFGQEIMLYAVGAGVAFGIIAVWALSQSFRPKANPIRSS